MPGRIVEPGEDERLLHATAPMRGERRRATQLRDALVRVLGRLQTLLDERGANPALSCNFAVTDGRSTVVCRHARAMESGTLYYSTGRRYECLDEDGDMIDAGAPGPQVAIVASLATLAPRDNELTELLLAGGELTWRAGPLRKGANLCHGTAGNGYAFLKLLERTGDELWLARARAFAMHSIAQVERAGTEFGRGRHSLWTGDPGTALYLASCLDATAEFPTLDAF